MKCLLQRIENAINELDVAAVKVVPVSSTENLLAALNEIKKWLDQVKEAREYGGPRKPCSGDRKTVLSKRAKRSTGTAHEVVPQT